MAWIDGKLEWLEPYINGPKYKKELNEIYLSVKHNDEVMRKMNSDNIIYLAEINEYKKKIKQLEIKAKESLPKVTDANYWNNKFPKKLIKYPNVDVTTHLKFREIKGITEIAYDILELYHVESADDVANAWNKWCVTNIETQTRRTTTLKEFKYKTELKETWRTPEETLKLKYGDCDDFMILGYFVIRKMLILLSKWEYNAHRLLCQVVFVFSSATKLPAPAGWHANLLWIHSDLNYYTLETTYYASKALTNFGKLPQKYNTMYQLIDFTFTSEYSFSVHDLERSSYDYKKTIK